MCKLISVIQFDGFMMYMYNVVTVFKNILFIFQPCYLKPVSCIIPFFVHSCKRGLQWRLYIDMKLAKELLNVLSVCINNCIKLSCIIKWHIALIQRSVIVVNLIRFVIHVGYYRGLDEFSFYSTFTFYSLLQHSVNKFLCSS